MEPWFMSCVKAALGLLTPQGGCFPPPSLHADGDCNQDLVLAGADLRGHWCLCAVCGGVMTFPKSAGASIRNTTSMLGFPLVNTQQLPCCLVAC